MQRVAVTPADIEDAKRHIQVGIDAGRNGTDVELTSLGVLSHVLLSLGVTLETEREGVE